MADGFLAPPDGPHVQYEFFAPFAHVPGKYEWCRIRSPSHGVFDVFIVLGESTAVPATVFVNSTLGEHFMKERYPECTTIRVPPGALRIEESPDGRTVTGHLQSSVGPMKAAQLQLKAPPGTFPKAVPYGGTGAPVWGGRWTCWGVDLSLEASCTGSITWQDGKQERLQNVAAIVTLGSFGRLAPR